LEVANLRLGMPLSSWGLTLSSQDALKLFFSFLRWVLLKLRVSRHGDISVEIIKFVGLSLFEPVLFF